MIGSIRGRLVAKHPPTLLIEVHGIGYEVQAPMTTIYRLPGLQDEVHLYVHHLVREDAQQLYGFDRDADRQLFRSLLKVNGVGAKLALTILSGIEADDLMQCIRDGDTARLTHLPGVGAKTAQRLIVEMRDRIDAQAIVSGDGATERRAPPADPVADAISGLIALGYKPQEASRFVHAVDCAGRRSEEIIREVLRSQVKA